MTKPRGRLGHIALSSIASAAVTWLVLVFAARKLGPAEYAQFMVVWGTFFAATSVLAGLQQEVTRSVSRASPTERRRGLIFGTMSIGLGGALLLVTSGLLWGERVLESGWPLELLILAIGFIGYSIANLMTGTLAARGSWGLYSSSILLEGLVRALAVVGVLIIDARDAAWAAAFTAGLIGWLGLAVFSRSARNAVRAVGDSDSNRFVVRSLQALAAAGCSALMISGFPVLLRATTPGELDADTGVLLVAVVSTRAPLLLLNSYQGPIIARLVASEMPVTSLLRQWMGRATVVVLSIGLGGFLVGPAVIRVVFGDQFQTSRSLVGMLAVGAGLLGVLTLSGWVALVRSAHKTFVAGWTLAVGVTACVLLSDMPLEARAVVALVLGPIVGIVVHLLLTVRVSDAPPSHSRSVGGPRSRN